MYLYYLKVWMEYKNVKCFTQYMSDYKINMSLSVDVCGTKFTHTFSLNRRLHFLWLLFDAATFSLFHFLFFLFTCTLYTR